MTLTGIKAIGFDVDGTLYHVPVEMKAQIGKQVIGWAAQKLGREIDEFTEEYLAKREKYRSNTLTLNSYGLDGEEFFQRIFDEYPVEKIANRDQRMVTLIEELRKKFRLFVITNGTQRQVELKLKSLGLIVDDFDPRIYCYDRGWVKPEPAPFLAAMESLNLQPEEIVYVGDRVDMDVEGAQAVGMRTILVGGKSDLPDECCETVYDVGSVL